jgi:hypothetical protein
VWTAIHWAMEDDVPLPAIDDTAKEKHFDRFFEMVRENLQERKDQAARLKIEDVSKSQFTIGMWNKLRPKTRKAGGDKDVADRLNFVRSRIAKKTAEIIGRADPTGEAYLEIEEVSWEELLMWGIYISIILDSDGKVIAIYIGSATGGFGVTGRVDHYDWIRSTGKIPKTEAFSAHLKEATKPGRIWHVRPLILVEPNSVPVSDMVILEGLFTDLCNALNPVCSTGRFRSQVVLDNYWPAVPKEMHEVSYSGLNGAHQLKQGSRKKMPLCSMQGKGCTSPADSCQSEATLMMYKDVFFYGCKKCAAVWYLWHSARYTRHALEIPMTAAQIEKDNAWKTTSLETKFELWLEWRASNVACPVPGGVLCICSGPVRGDVPATVGSIVVLTGEKRRFTCRNCYQAWKHSTRKWSKDDPPSDEFISEFWQRFEVHRRSGTISRFHPDKKSVEECFCGNGQMAKHGTPPQWEGPKIQLCKPCYKAGARDNVTNSNFKAWKAKRLQIGSSAKEKEARKEESVEECFCGNGQMAEHGTPPQWKGPKIQLCKPCYKAGARDNVTNSNFKAWKAKRMNTGSSAKEKKAIKEASEAAEDEKAPKAKKGAKVKETSEETAHSRPTRASKKAVNNTEDL